MENIEYKNHTIAIYVDDETNPRAWENFGTIYSNSRTYNFDGHTMEEIVSEDGKLELENYIYIKVYAHIHGGVELSFNRFTDSFDTGLFGIIAVDNDTVKREYNVKRISKKLKNIVLNRLQNEIIDLNCALCGNIYSYQITDKEDNVVSALTGFICPTNNEYNAMLAEAKEYIDCEIAHYENVNGKQLAFSFAI